MNGYGLNHLFRLIKSLCISIAQTLTVTIKSSHSATYVHKSSSCMIYETIFEIYENVTKIFNNKKSSQMLHLTLNMSNAQKRFKVSQKLMKIPCLKLF